LTETMKDVKEEREFPHWPRVYLAAIVSNAIVIAMLWAFSKVFS